MNIRSTATDTARTTALKTDTVAAETIAESLPFYPNPTTDAVTISYTLSQQSLVSITMSPLLSKHTSTLWQATQPAGTHATTVDIGSFPSGLYLIKLITPQGVQSAKIIKE